ncbi:hypothetical protein HXX76_001161 [Chlamydomonas incerta]|uniref:Uncharacterized protein n=1 Tax=Chlamydomonas incerta TaxID=51695 RepID=A0A835WBK4_CHLIN|nr:hypothetical protein HXX76_001161 [Chlamydomonas incerta]|eukprot:KAG2444408.1 hypothetical protein HXX76_001161 [Chlamydomonas incerta]
MLSLQNCDVARGLADQSRKWASFAPRTALGGCGSRASSFVTAARGRGGSIGDLSDPWREEERRQALLKYVREVQPASVVQFAEQTNPQVVAAMRQTVLNVVGSLPPQYFDVRINTVAESLAQLMLSIMTTGYMLRSAQFRMELQQSLAALPAHSTATASGSAAGAGAAGGAAAAGSGLGMPTVAALSPASSGGLSRATSASSSSSSAGSSSSDAAAAVALEVATAAEAAAAAAATAAVGTAFLYDGVGSPYAPGVQKKGLEGEVLRWHMGRGEVQRLPVAAYIDLLEQELAALRAQLGPAAAAPGGFDTGSTGTLPGALGGVGGSRSGAGSGGAGPAFGMPIAMAGGVEVLGPETPTGSFGSAGSGFSSASASASASSSPVSSAASSMDGLVCVSPLPGFGERTGSGAGSGGSGGGWKLGLGLLAGGAASAAAPASMGSGGIPLVVGSPLGLPRNELLDYLHGLQASGNGGFKELACSPNTASGEAVKEAMELFVGRLMGTTDPAALTQMNSEFSSTELSKVLFWLLAVGYTLKSIEARMDMEDGMGGPGSAAGRGPMGGGPAPGGSGGSGSGGQGGSGGGWGKGGGGKGNGGKGERKGGFGGLRGLLPGF